ELEDTKRQRKDRQAQDSTLSDGAGEERQSRDEELIGTLVAERYRILRLLGSGGMGAGYEAEAERTARRGAIKGLRLEMSKSRDLVARFVREARAATRISHPNVVEILDMGQEPDGALYMVQELLGGIDLRSRLADDPKPELLETIDIMVP